MERQVDTVILFPTVITLPRVKLEDFLRQAANDILFLLANPSSITTPSLQAGDPIRNGLLQLATLLKRMKILQTLKALNQAKIPHPLPSL